MSRQIIAASIVLVLTASPALAGVKLPLKNGAYIQDSCAQFEKYLKTREFHDFPDNRTTMWINAEPKEPLTIAPDAEQPPSGYCAIKNIKVSGDVYSGSGKCTEGTMEAVTGVYKFSYTITSPDKFESKGKTYLWCADYKWGLK